jgi:ATP-dependent Clp protease ATP-binding subunit ClpA
MKNKSHKSSKSNYFFISSIGTNLVKGIAATSVVNVCFDKELVMKPFTDHFSFVRKTISLCLIAAFVFTNVVAVRTLGADVSKTQPATATYTTDLTQLGRQGRLRQSPNFETEINRVLEVLEKGGNRQPVVVDQDGSVQDEIVEQIAIRVAKGSVPNALKDLSLVKLETTALYSNAMDSTKLDAAINHILESVLASKTTTVLFVDDLTTFVNAGNQKSAFVTALKDGKLKLIGGSSVAAYQDKIASNIDLASLFEVISVERSEKATREKADTRDESFIGDNVSPDLREMMDQDPSGNKRVDVILQARDADNA